MDWRARGRQRSHSTVAKKCRDRGILGGSFFCSRFDADCNNPKLVFVTLANQLSYFSAHFKEQVDRAYRADPGLKYSNVSNQLEELLVKPLRAIQNTFPPCVIVVDALDECVDENATSVILSSLSRHIDALSPLKFFITSRPEQRISGAFRNPRLHAATQLSNLHEDRLDIISHDLEHYLRVCLGDLGERWDLEDGWPRPSDISALVRLSSGLFIFARTAVKFIDDPNYSYPCNQLTRLLTTYPIADIGSPYQLLDLLYLQVLAGAYPQISMNLSVNLRLVLGTIAVLKYPLSTTEIEQLLGLEPRKVSITIKHLGALLTVSNGKIHLVHPLFFEFITDPRRCTNPKFAVGSAISHSRLLHGCLCSMELLRRDICKIRDPSLLNSEVKDLSERIAQYIPPHLQYACCSWTHHLACSHTSDIPFEMLNEFCSMRLLYWVEVCSLLGELRNAIISLDAVCQQLLVRSPIYLLQLILLTSLHRILWLC